MELILDLGPASSPWLPRSRSVCVIYEFFKRTTIPAVKSELDLRAIVFGASKESDVLQDDRLKNYHPIGVPLPRSRAFKIHCKDCDKLSPDSTRQCIVSLVWQTYLFPPPSFPLTILSDYAIQMVCRILVRPILLKPIEHVSGYL